MGAPPEAASVDMPLGPSGEIDPSAPNDVDSDVGVRRAHRAFTIAWIAALVSIALALALNWFVAPSAGDPFPGVVGDEPLPVPGEDFTPANTAVSLLPDRVLSYETITLQTVPGLSGNAAEAIYVTLNMDLEVQRPINTYARVEQFSSGAQAQQRVDEFMAPYSVDRADTLIGQGTIATAGFAPDDSAYSTAWVKGSNAYLVKASYRDIPPVQSARKFLVNVSKPVVDAVAVHEPMDE